MPKAAKTARTSTATKKTKNGDVTPRRALPARRVRTQPKPAAGKPRGRGKAIEAKADALPPAARSGTRLARLTDLLRRPSGATVSEIAAALGWQPHSVRGAISGSIRKKLGLAVTTEKVEDRGRVYRIPAGS